MYSITWTTEGGAHIEIAKGNLLVNGKPNGGCEVVNHPTHGPVVKAYVGGAIVKLPADKADAVREHLDASKAAAKAAGDAIEAYGKHVDAVLKMMEG